MISIEILVSINGSEEERKNLSLPQSAINEFLGEGFANNTYEGSVIQKCIPRYFNPKWIEVILTILDDPEKIIAWYTIIASIIKFLKKTKGYEPHLTIIRKKKEEEITFTIPLNENDDVESIVEIITNKIDETK